MTFDTLTKMSLPNAFKAFASSDISDSDTVIYRMYTFCIRNGYTG